MTKAHFLNGPYDKVSMVVESDPPGDLFTPARLISRSPIMSLQEESVFDPNISSTLFCHWYWLIAKTPSGDWIYEYQGEFDAKDAYRWIDERKNGNKGWISFDKEPTITQR